MGFRRVKTRLLMLSAPVIEAKQRVHWVEINDIKHLFHWSFYLNLTAFRTNCVLKIGMDASSFPPPPPAGLNYIAAIRPSLNFILVLTPLGAVLVPLILVLFFFSSPRSRRHPVFVFNILACCSGICEAALNAALETKQILYPLEPVSKSLLTSVIAFSIVSPVFIDSILLFRILAFYPLGTTPTSRLLTIFSLPVLVKSERFIAVVLYLNQFTHTGGKLSNVLLAAQSTGHKNPYILTEWSLQMIDDMWVPLICSFAPLIWYQLSGMLLSFSCGKFINSEGRQTTPFS